MCGHLLLLLIHEHDCILHDRGIQRGEVSLRQGRTARRGGQQRREEGRKESTTASFEGEPSLITGFPGHVVVVAVAVIRHLPANPSYFAD